MGEGSAPGSVHPPKAAAADVALLADEVTDFLLVVDAGVRLWTPGADVAVLALALDAKVCEKAVPEARVPVWAVWPGTGGAVERHDDAHHQRNDRKGAGKRNGKSLADSRTQSFIVLFGSMAAQI